MTNPDTQFRVVLRGYEPAQVDRALAQLGEQLSVSQQSIEQLTARVKKAESSSGGKGKSEPATFAHLGDRVGSILTLAQEEAAALKDRALGDAEETRKAAEIAAIGVRDKADGYADQRRRDADAEAARIIADAKKVADEERDAADRDAAARRQEAEALFEQQRTKAARAATDFETALAERRERSAAEFKEQETSARQQLDGLLAQVEENRARIDREKAEAEAESRRMVTSAKEEASAIVRDARSTAERVRTDSERELAAATQRRDSINAQLANVRQMLATLSGSATGFIVDALPDDVDPPKQG